MIGRSPWELTSDFSVRLTRWTMVFSKGWFNGAERWMIEDRNADASFLKHVRRYDKI